MSVDHCIRIPNTTESPVLIPKHAHLCQIYAVNCLESTGECDTTPHSPLQLSPEYNLPTRNHFSEAVDVNPDNLLSPTCQDKFIDINKAYDNVFNPKVPLYNGHSGNIQSIVNMGPTLPPQRKGRLPHYNPERLHELQQKCDDLEAMGILAKPEDVETRVEYLNLSFLVRKPSGGNRLVTDFGEVGKYSKPQPSLLPNTESVLRSIAQWKYLIKTDLTQAFYQIPLAHESLKYCGIVTPYKGVRVYTRCAMGMPGSETALEEIMSRVLGEFIQRGFVAKLADDLYIGGDSEEDLTNHWLEVLQALSRNNLGISATKTVITPKTTVVLGWVWENGTIRASPHRISTIASVDPPKTVKALRSFIGAFKVLSRVLQGYAEKIQPLDAAVAGKQSQDQISWTDDLLGAFSSAQRALDHCKVITLPRPSDTLWIVTDGAVKAGGMGATLYILRDNDLRLAGFFSARLQKHQITWLPCEVEALAIATSINHFAPYILQSLNQSHVLTDSRPCVLAYNKLCRGEFSNSARVTSFLSTVSRYRVTVGHLAGSVNLPSDFASRNPISCTDNSCQVCSFTENLQQASVRSLTVQEVVEGPTPMPFTSRPAWLQTQQECPDLRRVHAHLKQGNRPQKKLTNIPDVKRYLQSVTISGDGLLVIRETSPLRGYVERVVIPKHALMGLITAIHIKFCHPSSFQLKRLISRYFFALNLDKAVNEVTTSCHTCLALRSFPKTLIPQSTSEPPEILGHSFALDVMKRWKQCVVILRETVSSYTLTSLCESETAPDLGDAIGTLCAELKPLGSTCKIRIDAAPGLVALFNRNTLGQFGISLEKGRENNINKNPVAEKAVEELGAEILKVQPDGGPISRLTLATANLNSRLRQGGLSARDIWTQRDQITGDQLPFSDRDIVSSQHQTRVANHLPSAKSKAPRLLHPEVPALHVGDLVYLKQDMDKTKARDRYLIASIADSWCKVHKFTRNQFRSKLYDVRIIDCIPLFDLHPKSPPPNRSTMDASLSDEDDHVSTENNGAEGIPSHSPPHPMPGSLSHTPSYPPPQIIAPVPIMPSETPADDHGATQWRSRPPDSVTAPNVVPHDRPPDGVSIPAYVNRDSDDAVEDDIQPTIETPLRRSIRQKTLPVHLQDYILDWSVAMSMTLIHFSSD